MTQDEAIIVLLDGADPELDRVRKATGEATTTIVAVNGPAEAAAVARDLVERGTSRIELCGGLGPSGAAEVIAAVEGRVPVGAVSFGVESVDGAVVFRDKVAERIPMTAGFIFLQEGLDPVQDRSTLAIGTLRTVFVPVPDERAAVAAATGLVDDEGSELIELYRGIGARTAGEVIDAVGAIAPVGAARYAR